MAKRSKSQRLSSLLNVAGFIVDYNGYKYHAKNKKLVYLSLGLSTVGTVLDFTFQLSHHVSSKSSGSCYFNNKRC